MGPKTIRIGPTASSRKPLTLILVEGRNSPQRRALHQPNRRSRVIGATQLAVASSTISTTPSTRRSAGTGAPMSDTLATDDARAHGLDIEPLTLDLTILGKH